MEPEVQAPAIPRFRLAPVVVQACLVVAVALLGLIPPSEGRMLLAPLVPGQAGATAHVAVRAGARLVEPGPYAGAFYVEGRRSALLAAALSGGILLLNSSYGGCAGNGNRANG